jgi:hypothetical protein
MKTRESTSTLGVVRVCVSRGLAREALGLGLFQSVFPVCSVGCHSPFPEVAADFGFFAQLVLLILRGQWG